jgi:hypothetical protein
MVIESVMDVVHYREGKWALGKLAVEVSAAL